MNLFLKNGRSFSKNKSKYSSDLKINNKCTINTSSKKVINHRNKVYFLNHKKNNKHNLFLKIPKESLIKYELTQIGSPNNKNISKNVMSKTFESYNSNINYNTTQNEKMDKLFKNRSNKTICKINKYGMGKNKSINNLKKRKSLFNKGHNILNKMYGLSIVTNNPNSCNDNITSPETFFTSIPIEINNSSKKFNNKETENSKRNSQNLMMSLIQKLRLKKNFYETLKLKELKNQIHKFEISEHFQPSEQLIEKYLSSPDIFIISFYLITFLLKIHLYN